MKNYKLVLGLLGVFLIGGVMAMPINFGVNGNAFKNV